MAKCYYELYPQVIRLLNLWHAYKEAARSKRSQPVAATFPDSSYGDVGFRCVVSPPGE